MTHFWGVPYPESPGFGYWGEQYVIVIIIISRASSDQAGSYRSNQKSRFQVVKEKNKIK